MLIKILFLCFVGFLAAIIDAIAGGGGIITIPAYLLCGVPPHIALGTNKLCASCSAVTSSYGFIKSGKANFKLLKMLIPFSLVGAIFGVNTVLGLDPKYLNVIVLVLLFIVGIYTLFSKDIGMENKFKGLNKKNIFLGIIISFSLGFYDGFFGPGTGAFLIFGLTAVFKFDFVRSSANSKILNCTSNLTSLLLFAFNSKINYSIAIPVAICMIIGARFGTKLALNKGSKLIKPIFVTMSLLVAIKMLYQVVS